jgi:hypothetical protein
MQDGQESWQWRFFVMDILLGPFPKVFNFYCLILYLIWSVWNGHEKVIPFA